jgi:hypothetical protein
MPDINANDFQEKILTEKNVSAKLMMPTNGKKQLTHVSS